MSASTAEARVAAGETVEDRYEGGGETWLRTDRRLLRETASGVETLSLDAVEGVHRTSGDRDVRLLVAGLAALTLAVVFPTAAVGVGLSFMTVAPVAGLLAVACPVGLLLWYRSSAVFLELRVTPPAGRPWRLPESEGAAEFLTPFRGQV